MDMEPQAELFDIGGVDESALIPHSHEILFSVLWFIGCLWFSDLSILFKRILFIEVNGDTLLMAY